MPDCEILKPNLDGYAPTTYPSRTHHVAVHVAAIATFAEIATFYVMQRGSINTGSIGFHLQKEELVEYFIKLACESCRHVANFVVNAYVLVYLGKRPVDFGTG